MMTEFEDKYLDVLQNIEWALLSLVKKHPELCDHDMLRIVEKTLVYFKSRQRGNFPSRSEFMDVRQEIFDNTLSICQGRLIGVSPFNIKDRWDSITIDELLLCLKRIDKSIKFWTRQGGRKGYINFATPRALVS